MEALRVLMSKRTSDQLETPSKRILSHALQSDEARLYRLVNLTVDCAFQTILPAMQRVFAKYNLWFNAGLLTESYLIRSSIVCTAFKFILTLNPVIYIHLHREDDLLTNLYSNWGYGSVSMSRQNEVLHLRYNIDVLASIEAGFKDVCADYSQDPELGFVNPIVLNKLVSALNLRFHKIVKMPTAY